MNNNMIDMPRIGAANILTNAGGTYRPDHAGEWAAILEVKGFVLEPVDMVDGSLVWDDAYDVVDIVAWRPNDPGHWWLRRGDMTPIVGVRELRIAAEFGEPITVYETPQSWALAGGAGVAILIWGAPLNELFEGVGRVECESHTLRARFVEALRQWEPVVTERRTRRAA